MKKNLLLLLSFCTFSAAVTAQNFEDPGAYNTYINQQQERITQKYLAYNSAVAHGRNAKKIEKQRTKLLDEVQEAKMNISGMPSLQGYKAYRDSAVSFLKFYYNVLNEDYSKIVNMEEIAEQSYDLMEAYLLAQEKVDEKLGLANEMMKREHQKFADKFNMKLIDGDSETGKLSRKVSEINNYHHKLYLVFFKSYKQELYLMEAIQKGNMLGIEQNRSALSATAKEGLEKLAAISAFDGDNNLVAATKTLLQFYQKEADQQVPAITDFFLKKDRFETMKKEMDKKGSDRSKEDIDNYNKAVNDYNAAAKKFNESMNGLNKSKNDFLNDWNKASASFLDEHTPKYKA